MEARVKKWGNSLAIRIPQSVAEDVGLTEDSAVDLVVRSGKLVIGPKKRDYSLQELLSKVSKDNLHQSTDWGPPTGAEVW